MKTKKLTSAQTYAKQVKADRRAAALERLVDPAIKVEMERVRQMYQK
jgi:hypothetical protein